MKGKCQTFLDNLNGAAMRQIMRLDGVCLGETKGMEPGLVREQGQRQLFRMGLKCALRAW